MSSSAQERELFYAVYAFVRRIPAGSVVTYGQVAGCMEDVALTARQVGYAMAQAPVDVPWQRVVGAGGRLTTGKRSPELCARQRSLLEQEGVRFVPGSSDRVDMAHCQWHADFESLPGLFE